MLGWLELELGTSVSAQTSKSEGSPRFSVWLNMSCTYSCTQSFCASSLYFGHFWALILWHVWTVANNNLTVSQLHIISEPYALKQLSTLAFWLDVREQCQNANVRNCRNKNISVGTIIYANISIYIYIPYNHQLMGITLLWYHNVVFSWGSPVARGCTWLRPSPNGSWILSPGHPALLTERSRASEASPEGAMSHGQGVYPLVI